MHINALLLKHMHKRSTRSRFSTTCILNERNLLNI